MARNSNELLRLQHHDLFFGSDISLGDSMDVREEGAEGAGSAISLGYSTSQKSAQNAKANNVISFYSLVTSASSELS